MEEKKLGATGDFPDGKLTPDDEGEMVLAVSSNRDARLVAMNFGEKPVKWFAIPPEQALEIADALIAAAKRVMSSQTKQENPRSHGDTAWYRQLGNLLRLYVSAGGGRT